MGEKWEGACLLLEKGSVLHEKRIEKTKIEKGQKAFFLLL